VEGSKRNGSALDALKTTCLASLTVLLGPNGSGKSTLFDLFNFLAECFQFGLRHAWDRRGRGKELKTRGQKGPVVTEPMPDGRLLLQIKDAPFDRPVLAGYAPDHLDQIEGNWPQAAGAWPIEKRRLPRSYCGSRRFWKLAFGSLINGIAEQFRALEMRSGLFLSPCHL